MPERVPVIVLAGYLGSGKTTVLNHVLRMPGSRVGVIVNDFGTINLDAGLVAGQVDDPVSISGGCLCCIDDIRGLDPALESLASRDLDAIIIEASGIADPVTLAQMVRFSGVERVRPGGVVDVIDASEHHRTIDTGVLAPSRYGAATMVLVNKLDLVPEERHDEVLSRISARVREVNPDAPILPVEHGAVDPALLFDATPREPPSDELPLWEVTSAAPAAGAGERGSGAHGLGAHDTDAHDPHTHHAHAHAHAHSVTLAAEHPVSADALLDLLEDPPSGAYRMKGCIDVSVGRRTRRYTVNVVGRSVHVAPTSKRSDPPRCLVAIGPDLDEQAAEQRMREAVGDKSSVSSPHGLQRLRRVLTLSA